MNQKRPGVPCPALPPGGCIQRPPPLPGPGNPLPTIQSAAHYHDSRGGGPWVSPRCAQGRRGRGPGGGEGGGVCLTRTPRGGGPGTPLPIDPFLGFCVHFLRTAAEKVFGVLKKIVQKFAEKIYNCGGSKSGHRKGEEKEQVWKT